jgi:hypothetical protein
MPRGAREVTMGVRRTGCVCGAKRIIHAGHPVSGVELALVSPSGISCRPLLSIRVVHHPTAVSLSLCARSPGAARGVAPTVLGVPVPEGMEGHVQQAESGHTLAVSLPETTTALLPLSHPRMQPAGPRRAFPASAAGPFLSRPLPLSSARPSPPEARRRSSSQGSRTFFEPSRDAAPGR